MGSAKGPSKDISATAVWPVPTVIIAGVPNTISNTDPFDVTLYFSEKVKLRKLKVAVNGGIKGPILGKKTDTYTFEVTPDGGKDVVVTVEQNAATAVVGSAKGPSKDISATAVWPASLLVTSDSSILAEGSDLTFKVKLDKFPSNDVDVAVTLSDDSDVVHDPSININPETLTFTNLDGTTAQSVTLTHTGNHEVESGGIFWVTFATSDGLLQVDYSITFQDDDGVADTTPPGVAISGVPNQINNTSAFTARFTFDENVTGFEASDVTITGGTGAIFAVVSATEYELLVTPAGGQDVVVTVAANSATDDANNTGPSADVSATATWPREIDAPQTLSMNEGGTGAFDVELSAVPSGTVTVSISGHAGTDLAGTPPNPLSLTFDATDYNIPQSVTLTASDDPDFSNDTVELTLTASGGGYSATHILTVTITDDDVADTTPPGVAISGVPNQINNTSAFTARFTFDENVTGFEASDVTITGGTGAIFAVVSATEYELLVTPAGGQDVVVTVAANSATDDFGNLGPEEAVTATAVWDAVTVTLTASPPEVVEGNTITVDVTLSAALLNPITIDLTYTDVTTEPADYDPLEQITILAGALTGTGDLVTNDDDIAELTETFTLALGNLPTGLIPGDPSSVDLTILDDGDIPPPAEVSLSVDPTEIDEGGTVTVELTLSETLTADVVVPLAYPPGGTAETRDYVALEQVTISSGETVGTGQITTVQDMDVDDETFTVALGSLPAELAAGRETSQTVTIRDIYPIEVRIVSATPNPVDEGDALTVTVELAAALLTDVAIPLELTGVTADAQDYHAAPPVQVEIEAGDTRGTYQVSIIQDAVAEDDETFTVAFGALPDVVVAGNPSEIEVTITDDDVVGIEVPSSVSVIEGRSGTFDISLTSVPLDAVTVTLTGYSGTDLTPSPISFLFAPGNWNQPQQVTLAAAEDVDFAHDEVVLTLAANGGEYTGVTNRVIVTITDNDAPGIDAPALVTIAEGGTRDLPVALTTQPSGDVTVTFPFTMGDLMIAPTRVLVFSPGDWNVPQAITLAAKEDDDFADDREEITLTANGGGYVGVTRLVKVMISDDDTPAIAAEPEVTMEEGGTYPLGVRLLAQPSGSVAVALTGHVGTDLTLDQDLLTFTTTNWSIPQTVTLTAAEDDQDLEEDRVELLLTASGGSYDNVTHLTRVTITDNDVPVGPLSLSIYDQREPEDAGTLHLQVGLSYRTDKTVTVRYATTDVEAEGGADYTESRGIVIFAPGATRGTITIDLTDDNILEEAERFEVTLSSPNNAIIARGTGTGTILDNDGGAHLWIDDAIASEDEEEVKFRVVLSQPQLQMISASYQTQDGTAKAGEDYEASSGVVMLPPGTTETLIAVPLLNNSFDWGEKNFSVILMSSRQAEITKKIGVATIHETTAIEEEVLEAYVARFVRTYSSQIVDAVSERIRSGRMVSACGAGARAEMAQLWYTASSWEPSLGELLAGCRISMTEPSGGFSLWGRGAFRQFDGQGTDGLTLDGEVTTGMLGVDYRWHRVLAGVLLGHSQGDGSFEAAEQSGAVTAGLTGIYPYVSYVQSGWELWMSGGFGWGQAEVSDLTGDLVSRFGEMGMRGSLVQTSVVGLNYHGDVLLTDAEISDHDVMAEVYRFRAGVEANARISDGFRPYVVANVRQDGGNAETGTGLEFGGGIRIAYPAWRLRGQVHTQGLVMHTEEAFSEWGFSGTLQVGMESEGFIMRLRPSWGRGQGMRMYQQQTMLDAAPLGVNVHRTELELGYGVQWKDGIVRPMMGMTQMQNSTIYRLGGELRPGEQLTFSLFGLAYGKTNALEDVGINLRGILQY